jgi:hypothetical protein
MLVFVFFCVLCKGMKYGEVERCMYPFMQMMNRALLLLLLPACCLPADGSWLCVRCDYFDAIFALLYRTQFSNPLHGTGVLFFATGQLAVGAHTHKLMHYRAALLLVSLNASPRTPGSQELKNLRSRNIKPLSSCAPIRSKTPPFLCRQSLP